MKKSLSTAAQAVKKQRRRNRLINALIVLLLLALVAGGLVMNIRYNRQNYTVEFYQMESKKLTHSIRVAFLTDVHLREYGKNNEDLVQEVKNLAPDIILLGGDMVTAGKDGYDTALKLCERLAQLAPTYGVLGNHEHAHVGGPRTAKFHMDEAQVLEDRMGPGPTAAMRVFASVSGPRWKPVNPGSVSASRISRTRSARKLKQSSASPSFMPA